MHNKKYYLVSPRVDGVTIQGFIETMFEQHIVMMGWGTDNKIGADFNNLKKGDFVIVAQRVNWVFTYYFAGIIDDEQSFSNDDGILCRKLRSFIDLRGYNEDFLANASFASMSVIKAMMNINPSNNIEIIKKLDKIIAMQENKDYVNSFVSLLKSNHNLILTGAPGTGKTYLAKEIAKSMGAEYKLVQFHPSYDYTDFVEGLRPVKSDGSLGFQRKDGVFKTFCKEAISSVESSFDDAYAELINKIKNGSIKTIKLKTKDSAELDIRGDDNIGWYSEREPGHKSSNLVSKARLQKLFSVYDTVEVIDGMSNINRSILSVIGGCDSSYYWGVLRYLVDHINNRPKPYILIIDEINRGEISKIFGELFLSIDTGYRGEEHKVDTQYQNLIPKEGDTDFDPNKADVFRNGFFIPKNVYIIGTMNDIDRSVESMDFAMRRRFAWKEITAKSRQSMLDEEDAWGANGKPSDDIIKEIKNRMDNLNAAIIDQYGDEALSNKDKIGLSKAYQIGASYFLKYSLYNNFDDLWTNHIEGLLYEYLRGKTNIDEKIERLHQAYNDTTQH